MKRIMIILITGMLIGMSNIALSDELSGPAGIVQQFFKAAKTGDVETMKSLITGPFFNRRKALIENNPEYSEFLRKQFSDVNIAVISASINNESGLASVMIEWLYPDGSSFDTEYLLKLSEEEGAWKIFDERLEQ